MNYDEKLEELYIDLPEAPANVGNTLATIRVGKLLYVTGVLPFSEGRIQYAGRVGVEIGQGNARLAARMAAVMALAMARKELGGSLKDIKRVVSMEGFVACGAEFRDHTKVLDGASELFVQVFGTNGRHTRTAVGVLSLPQNACVELAVVFEVK